MNTNHLRMKGIGLHKYCTGDRFVWTLNKRGGNDWLIANPDIKFKLNIY